MKQLQSFLGSALTTAASNIKFATGFKLIDKFLLSIPAIERMLRARYLAKVCRATKNEFNKNSLYGCQIVSISAS